MAPYILIGLVLVSTLISWIISRKPILTLINFIISMLNFSLGMLHMTIFPYLFGHCNGCLSLDIAEGKLNGIDFSRREKALGTSFDANDVLHITSAVIFIVGFIITLIMSNKKIDSKLKKWIYNFLMFVILIIQFGFLQMFVYA